MDLKSSPYFYSKKYLKHFITKLIEVELKVKAKLKVAIMIPPTLRTHSSLGLSGVDCTVLYPQRLLVTRGGLERYFWVTGQGRKPRPGLGSLPWPAPLWASFTRTPSRRPSHTLGAVRSTTGSSSLLWATEWAESLWLLSVSPALWVLPQ